MSQRRGGFCEVGRKSIAKHVRCLIRNDRRHGALRRALCRGPGSSRNTLKHANTPSPDENNIGDADLEALGELASIVARS